jgi:hypothetical protein
MAQKNRRRAAGPAAAAHSSVSAAEANTSTAESNWSTRMVRAMRRVLPRDGNWHEIRTEIFVRGGDALTRFVFRCRGRTAHCGLTAAEMDAIIRQGILLGEPMGHG